MHVLPSRLFLVFLILLAPAAFAHDITLTGTQSFASIDGSASDHDGSANGVFTVSDGNLVVNGVVNCNDDGASANACAMAFAVSGNMTVNAGGALYAENRSGGGTGGAITMTVGGNLALNGNAIISTASSTSSGSTGGAITANVSGTVSIANGSTIDSGATNAQGGNITISAGGAVSVDGNVLSGPSRTILSTRLTGVALNGGTANQGGGQITIGSTTFAEPALLVGTNANIISQGENNGAGPVTLDACGIQVQGLVAALSRKDSAAKVVIRSGKDVLVDGRDLGAAGTRMGRLRADAPSGTAVNKGVDIFAKETIDLFGPGGTMYLITSLPGLHDSKSYGGLIRVTSTEDAVNGSGNVIDNGHTASGDTGGASEISAKGDITLNTAVIHSVGDFSTNNSNRGGGSIAVRSYSGNIIWTNGTGDVRPVGSTSGLPLADQGTITLTACGTVNTTGTSFPTNGVPTGVFPVVTTGVCSPAAPSLPSGSLPLVTCNTPPVANDTSATTNEDTTVTITLSGTDADGDSLTFSIVSGPFNGVLGPVISTGPTTATVDYTPNANYNGSDSFVFQANDGNGGTDNATASITIVAVNDPPSFQIGPTVTALEDSGANTYSNWVTAISPGPADESGQTVTFSTSNNNNALFSVQPSVDSNGNLTFTPAPNACGSATVTVTAQDNGGIANGGDDTSNPQTSTITITCVNDEPSFTGGGNVSVDEDSGAYSATWATSISAGPANESGQTLTFNVSNDNNALFSAQPAISPSGVLTFTPAANANGSATVTVYLMDDGGIANGGDDTSPSQTFTITVNAVNDEPSFTGGGDVSVDEDSGAYSAVWATAISAGPADESGQTLTFNVSNDNNALFASQPSIAADGTLTFTPAANAFGSATVTVSLTDSGSNVPPNDNTSPSQTFTISVGAINDEPSFTAGGDVTVNEDSGAYSATWATAISAGPNESGQTLTFNVSNDNNALFSVQPSIDASGNLTFTPAADAFGSATVSVYLMDDGGTAGGGDDTSPTVTFTITVNAVNDEPSFTTGGNVTVNEDSGAYSAAWATAISAGPANESGQTLTFNVSNNNNALFSVQPSIDASGNLTFTPAANAFGSATVSVYLMDDGGIANGGDDTSPTVTFTITVNSVNDEPSFTPGGDVTVNEDSGPYAAAWATAISAGPANEAGQTVTFTVTNNNNGLFLVQPSISSTGVLTFTPALNANGSATVSVYLMDNGGIANGGDDTSPTVQFTINVTAVNDAPVAGADAWDTLGNTELRVDFPGGLTPKISDTTSSGNGVADNDSDLEGDPFIITGIVGCSDVTAPFDCTLGDGSKVSMLANGSFSYTPGPGNTSGSFQYTLTDIPTLGTPQSSTGTVTITIYDMIWYVNGTAAPGGNGTSIAPYNDFTSLDGVGGLGDVDLAGSTIFVHTSAVAGSIPMEANQKLHGEGVGLSTNNNLNGNGSPQVLVAPGVKPTVTSATNTVTVNSVAGVDIAGLSLSSTGGNAIDVTNPPAGPVTGASIHDNVVTAATAEGIDVNGGSAAGTTVTIDNTSITSVGNGLDVTANGSATISYTNGTILSTGGDGIRMNGTLTITGLGNVVVSGNTAGDGINISGTALFDAIPGGGVNTVNGGSISVGASGNPVGGAAITILGASGSYAIGALNAFGTTSGVTVEGVAGTMTISNTSGAITAGNGVGLRVKDAVIAAAGLNFTSISSTGGANGIYLQNTGASGGLTVTGTGAADSGGTLLNHTGDSIFLASTQDVSLTNLQVTNSGDNAVDATTVTRLTLDSVDITTTSNTGILGNGVTDFKFRNGSVMTGAGNAANEHGIFITDLFGASSAISNSSVTGSAVINVFISNFASTAGTLTISNSTLGNTAALTGGDAVSINGNGTANLTVNMTGGNNLNNNQGDGIQVAANGSSTVTATINGATSNYNGNLGSAVNIAAANSSLLVANVSGFTGLSSGTSALNGLNVINIQNFDTSTINATVNGNSITGLGNNASGIRVIQEGNGTINANLNNNNITGLQGAGILGQARAGTGLLSLTIAQNVINLAAGAPLDGVNLESGSSAGGTNTICLNMLNNSSSATGQQGYRLRQRAGTTFNLQNFAGSGASTADVTTWVNTTKSNTGTTDIVIGTAFSNAPANCATP